MYKRGEFEISLQGVSKELLFTPHSSLTHYSLTPTHNYPNKALELQSNNSHSMACNQTPLYYEINGVSKTRGKITLMFNENYTYTNVPLS